MKEYLSITQASNLKKVARNSIYVAIATGKLDSLTIAGKLLVVKNQKFDSYKSIKTIK